MSYILKALRKSEQERQQVTPQTLAMRLQPSETAPETKGRGWIFVLLLVNAILVVGGVVLFLVVGEQEGEERPESIQDINVQPKSLPRKEAGQPENILMPIPEKKAHAILSGKTDQLSIASLMQQQKRERQPAPDKPVEVQDEEGDNAVEENPVKADVMEAVQSPLESAVQKQNHDSLPEKESKMPWLHQMPLEFKRSVPKIQFNVFVYSDNVQESFVMLDWTKYRAGDELPSGLVIKQILQDSAVFEYRQRQFRFSRK